MYPVDIAFCAAAGTAVLIAFQRLGRLNGLANGFPRYAIVDYVGLTSAIVVGAWGGLHNPAAALTAFVALLLGLTYGFGLCDVVLAVGAALVVGTQYGFGWVSIAGYIGLSLLAVASIRSARTAALFRSAQ